MAKLILSLDGSVIRELSLDKERITIGRKPQNDIQIENLAVSSEHACVVTILNDSFLEDLGSTNGTLVNGTPIKKHILQNSDVIEIGKYKLKFVNDGPAVTQTTVEDFERTMVLRAPSAASRPTPPAPQPAPQPTSPAAPAVESRPAPAPVTTPSPVRAIEAAPASAAMQQACIQLMSGPGVGKELQLTKSLTTLGKPGVQVAVITKRPQGYFITHVEGAKFPVLNGRTLDNQAHALGDHDMIEIAGVKMEFFFKK
jgi:pSer/pThr/pTyr-binding forkhead associated (FHA) protein